jgi:hypothetical protein
LPFKTTPNKDLLRKRFDLDAVEDHFIKKGRELTYFGLPGPQILDILEWKKYLKTVIAVERDLYAKHFMRSKAFSKGFDPSNFQILFGDIDDIILKGEDLDGAKPVEEAFDLINLDYEGGLVYKDLMGDSKRVKAIKRLFDMQQESKRDFLLLLTINTRNRDWGEFNKTLDQIQEELEEYNVENIAGVIDWYKDAGYAYKIKVYLPVHLGIWARSHSFYCSEVKAVMYLGSSNRRMVHFACSFDYGEPKLGQSLVRILSMPMYEAEGGKIKIAKMQPPTT